MDTFILKWTDKDSTIGQRNINRDDFLNLMHQIKENFINNNVYATKFVQIVPDLKELKINYKRNQDMDIPFVTCVTRAGEEVLSIPRVNKIIWGILEEYSK